jgi:hypothetical protein
MKNVARKSTAKNINPNANAMTEELEAILQVYEQEMADLQSQMVEENRVSVNLVLDLLKVLKAIKQQPSMKDLVRLARRIQQARSF